MTFRDIWLDYQNFRRNYYFYQLPSAKDIYERHAEPVNVETFRVSRWALDLFKNRDRHPYLSPQWLFVRLVMMLTLFYLWRLLRWPIEWYQDWHDPLKPSGAGGSEGAASFGTEEEIRERLRYKKPVKGWL